MRNRQAREAVAAAIAARGNPVPEAELPYLAWCARARRVLRPDLCLAPFETRPDACRWLRGMAEEVSQ